MKVEKPALFFFPLVVKRIFTMLYAYPICYMHIAEKKYDGKSVLNTLLELS